jgi:serine/threonine-protein kinase
MNLRGVEPLTRQHCKRCGEPFWVPCYLGDRYLINRPLGKGRTSLVCAGYDTVMDRLVAVKLLRHQHGDRSAAWKQAQLEGQLLAKVNHTNVVQTFLLSDNKEQPFIVMEYVDGMDVRRAVRKHGLISPVQAVRLMLGAVNGLQAAHAVGLLHGDLDPGNLMMSKTGEAKLIDFGRAAELETGHGEDADQAGFLSPEALLNLKLDARADFYALSATMFYALTGKCPLPRERGQRLAYDPWRLKPPLARKINPTIPIVLSDTLDWMMSPKPDARPLNHTRLIRHLEQIERAVLREQQTSGAA